MAERPYYVYILASRSRILYFVRDDKGAVGWWGEKDQGESKYLREDA
jgi:hypothetical protein